MGTFRVSFSRLLAAACLWDYGEDELVERALQMSDADLEGVQEIAARYENTTYPLPDPGQRITHGHVIAYAAVTHFEGRLRPLARGRRRPQRERPPRLGGNEDS